MSSILTRLSTYGPLVLELDFSKSRLYSKIPMEDVERLIKLCPNVISLRMPYDCLTSDGVQRLIRHYSQKRTGDDGDHHHHASSSSQSTPIRMPGGGTAIFPATTSYEGKDLKSRNQSYGQLRSLCLDLSQTTLQPSGMNFITNIGARLRRLELKLNLRQPLLDAMRTYWLDYKELLEACTGLEDLEIVPAPHFLSSKPTTPWVPGWIHDELRQRVLHFMAAIAEGAGQGNGALKSTTTMTTLETLKVFETYRSSLVWLTRLHMGRVWFSDPELWTLADACPGLLDLRLTVVPEDEHLSRGQLYQIREQERNLLIIQEEEINGAKSNLSLGTVLRCWPRLKKLRLDGNKVSMFSKVDLSSSVMFADAGLLSKGSYSLSFLCLYNTVSLTDLDLIFMLDLLAPTLQYLNVDRNVHLTDRSIRHVLMSCPRLRHLSAAELNLSMALFEDEEEEGFSEVGLEQVDGIEEIVRRPGRELTKMWACTKTLETMDLSWRSADGRPIRLPRGTIDPYIDSSWEHMLPGYRHNPHSWPRDRQCRTRRVPLAQLDSQDGSMRLFRKHWQIESIYERLRMLTNLEVLQLQGWLVPWRAADITAFLGCSPELESIDCLDPRVEHSSLCVEKTNGQETDQDEDGVRDHNESLYQEADSIVIKVINQDLISFPLYQHGSSTDLNEVDSKAAVAPIPLSGLNKLRHLNIHCRNATFFKNRTGLASPFIISERVERECETINKDTRVEGSLDEQLDETKSTWAYDKALVFSVLGAFMKASPRLKTVVIRARHLDVLEVHAFTAQLTLTPSSESNTKPWISKRRMFCMTTESIQIY
ncbi:hypothetical protein BGX28_009035 [Mortierella sp. GBA30]|nr:hypothetical protein BGX28_009035 [Mortierella sp. GBA30]